MTRQAGRESKRQKAEREQAVLADPDALADLCACVADRGTLAEWCKAKGLRYGTVHAWLHDADHGLRLERYTLALEAQQGALRDVVLGGLRDIAQADVRRLFDANGQLLDPHRLPEDLARVVTSYDEDDKGVRKVRLESRKGGHELLGRALGLYRDRIEHEGKVTLEEMVGGSLPGSIPASTPAGGERDSAPNLRSAPKTKGL